MPRSLKEHKTEEVEVPRWWDDAEHFVVIHKSHSFTSGFLAGRDDVPEGVDVEEGVVFVAGEEVPRAWVLPHTWQECGFRFAALDGSGERLDRRTHAERAGDVDAERALRTWRAENGLRRRTVQVFECVECGKQFETAAALNGHQSAHVEASAESGVETATMAERLDGEGESAGEGLTREDVDGEFDGAAAGGEQS